MRGKAVCNADRLRAGGITPAYAGKSGANRLQAGNAQDHPRVCGEKSAVSGCCAATSGSPPRMRGKVTASVGIAVAPGITPAYAGKSNALLREAGRIWDHPRVCGEKLGLCLLCIRCLGSPPRMRGKAVATRKEAESIRITPAYAGKSGANRLQAGNAQDHPRVCGEK